MPPDSDPRPFVVARGPRLVLCPPPPSSAPVPARRVPARLPRPLSQDSSYAGGRRPELDRASSSMVTGSGPPSSCRREVSFKFRSMGGRRRSGAALVAGCEMAPCTAGGFELAGAGEIVRHHQSAVSGTQCEEDYPEVRDCAERGGQRLTDTDTAIWAHSIRRGQAILHPGCYWRWRWRGGLVTQIEAIRAVAYPLKSSVARFPTSSNDNDDDHCNDGEGHDASGGDSADQRGTCLGFGLCVWNVRVRRLDWGRNGVGRESLAQGCESSWDMERIVHQAATH